MKNVDLRHFRYFLVLAEELHFGRAAQRLSISQPPLSLTIQQLEHHMGATLFTRNSKQVRLTEEGLAFVPKARALLQQADDTVAYIRDMGAGVRGRLQVGFVGAMLYRGLPELLNRFQQQHPHFRITLQEMNSQEQLRELMLTKLDVGFVHSRRIPQELKSWSCEQETFLCCLPDQHPLAKAPTLKLHQLSGESLVLFSRHVSPDYHERIVSIFKHTGLEPILKHEGRHWLSIVSMVAQGLGVALVPACMRSVRLAGVAFVPVKDMEQEVSNTQCTWKNENHNPVLPVFLEAVKTSLHSSL